MEAYQALLESEVLLSGTADGYLQIHETSGQVLYRQRLHGSAVMDILVRPHCSGEGGGCQAWCPLMTESLAGRDRGCADLGLNI